MSDCQASFDLIATNASLIEGVLISIEKIGIKNNHKSNYAIGTIKRGHIKFNLEYKRPLFLKEWGDSWVTSEIEKIFIENEKTCIETRTSIYEITFPFPEK